MVKTEYNIIDSKKRENIITLNSILLETEEPYLWGESKKKETFYS